MELARRVPMMASGDADTAVLAAAGDNFSRLALLLSAFLSRSREKATSQKQPVAA